MLILELWGAEWNTQQAQIHLIILKLSGPMAVLLSVCIYYIFELRLDLA